MRKPLTTALHRDTKANATYDCLIRCTRQITDTCNADTYAYIDYKSRMARCFMVARDFVVSKTRHQASLPTVASLRDQFYNGGGTTSTFTT
jgi:hypothetical protein